MNPEPTVTSTNNKCFHYIHQNISLKKERHYTLVISEKNRGVDAVAERLHQNKYNQVISFGSDNIGDFTKSYLIENKLQYHSVVTNTYQQIYELEQSCEQKTRKIKRVLYNCLPKYILKNLSWRNIGLIQHQINNANIRNNKKKELDSVIKNCANKLELNEFKELCKIIHLNKFEQVLLLYYKFLD